MARKRRSRDGAAPDTTPLIDVVFLLLIFFMVSTVFKTEELALLLKLPTAGTDGMSREELPNKIFIELSIEDLAVNGKKTSFDEFQKTLQSLKETKDAKVELRIDQDVKYQRVVSVLDVLEKFNIHDLALIKLPAR